MNKNEYLQAQFQNEDQFQAATYMYINHNYPALRRLIFHVPNQGAKNPREGMKLKSMGVIAGIPDLICLYPAFGLELKMPDGRLSPAQKDLHASWAGKVPVYVCWNAQDVVDLFNLTLKLNRI